MGLLASPNYLAQAAPISGPQDLPGHRWIVADPLRQLRLTHSQTGEVYSQSLYGAALRGMFRLPAGTLHSGVRHPPRALGRI